MYALLLYIAALSTNEFVNPFRIIMVFMKQLDQKIVKHQFEYIQNLSRSLSHL